MYQTHRPDAYRARRRKPTVGEQLVRLTEILNDAHRQAVPGAQTAGLRRTLDAARLMTRDIGTALGFELDPPQPGG